MVKRIFEIFFSSIVLLFSFPFMLIFGLIIFFEDFKNPIFIQERLGKNKNTFHIFKLRTMKLNSPNVGTHETNEDMYLKSSKLIRRLKIDEFPQFLNVLIGHMSLVGPRPCLPNQYKLIEEREKMNVFSHKPGITGVTQIKNIMMDQEAKQAKVDSIYNVYFGARSNMVENIKLYFFCICRTVLKGDLSYIDRLIEKNA